MKIQVSNGELLDKLSILSIKKQKLKGDKLENVEKEYKYLQKKYDALYVTISPVVRNEFVMYNTELKIINYKLWEIEDDIRECEKEKNFGKRFIELARQVYKTNDERSKIKKIINLLTDSSFVEEKSYQDYD
jgi:hypothetical protein|tara:strand:+ start:187 stop:582 length:396 start_codon:yes stop_codon:yes gene_type:complete